MIYVSDSWDINQVNSHIIDQIQNEWSRKDTLPKEGGS